MEIESIIAQWDALAPERLRQIESGQDITYRLFLVPHILKLAGRMGGMRIIDIGCGVGFLARILSDESANVIGIDPSQESIRIASIYTNEVKFIVSTVEDYVNQCCEKNDIAICNMVFMDVIDLNKAVSACAKILRPGGRLIFSITHPFFWPKYAGYEDKEFVYSQEKIIQAPFVITNDNSINLISTHVHRPISVYINTFIKYGFRIEQICEPMPEKDVEDLYKSKWEFPRYLFGSLSLPS